MKAPSEGNGPKRSESSSVDEPRPSSRLPYSRPVLKHLGSVRALTIGASAGFAEGAGTFIMP